MGRWRVHKCDCFAGRGVLYKSGLGLESSRPGPPAQGCDSELSDRAGASTPRIRPVDTEPMPILREGDLLNGRFRVVGPKPLGSGQFAEVYKAVDEQDPTGKKKEVAIKIEREDKTSSREMRALRDLQGCKGVAKLVDSGSKKASPFIVMELMKANLADVRSKIPGQRYAKATTGWIGAQMLDILRGIHERGYVHGTSSPATRTLGGNLSRDDAGPSTRTLCLIDMGLAKKFETTSTPANTGPGAFRGSTTYASMFAHAGDEQGPRDDAWSLLYMLAVPRGRCRGGR